jgi:predicted RNA-binding Zn-ribbon protein involved in translation (DUF1610 family)
MSNKKKILRCATNVQVVFNCPGCGQTEQSIPEEALNMELIDIKNDEPSKAIVVTGVCPGCGEELRVTWGIA